MTVAGDTSKKPCTFCGELIGASNFARHVKVCPGRATFELKQELAETQEKNEKLAQEVKEKEEKIEQLKSSQTVINNHYGNNNTQTNNVQNNVSVENKTNVQNNIQKNIYHCHRKDKEGKIVGLDMNKIGSFGYENWDYIDKSKPPVEILMDLYAHPDHPENYIFTYREKEKFRLMVKFPQEIRQYPLDIGPLYTIGNLILENLKNHGVQIPEDNQERMVWTVFLQRFTQKYNYHNEYVNWNQKDMGEYYIKLH